MDAEHSSIRPTPAQASVHAHAGQGMSEHRPAAALGRVVAGRPDDEAAVCGGHGSGRQAAVGWQLAVLNACLSSLHGCSTACKLQQATQAWARPSEAGCYTHCTRRCDRRCDGARAWLVYQATPRRSSSASIVAGWRCWRAAQRIAAQSSASQLNASSPTATHDDRRAAGSPGARLAGQSKWGCERPTPTRMRITRCPLLRKSQTYYLTVCSLVCCNTRYE